MSLAGRAGIGDCAWIGRLLELPAVPGRHDVVVDLSLLSAMDWWVTLMVLWADRVLSRRGWTLVLAGPQPIVARLLADAGATEIVAAAAGVGRGAAAGQKYIAIR
jgi:anti-anti-sigma regulatory factor